jgi:phage shock protein PspC (stress-responsive transcriptional regulator)
MQKVIGIHLSGHAYHVEEAGYETLAAYLAGAERQLGGNPDRAEIMLDLEQAVADRCYALLNPHKTVVTAAEIEAIVAEMGPVEPAEATPEAAGQAGDGEGGAQPDATSSEKAHAGDGAAGDRETERPDRRLYRIPDGAVIGGVCNGLAAYFKIDVTIVRIAFVIMGLLTRGAGIVAYVVMMFVIPEAATARERAAAGGAPFNARDIVNRAKAGYTAGSRRVRREWRRQVRRHRWQTAGPDAYGPPPVAAVLMPVFGLIHIALFVIVIAIVISLVNSGEILGWYLPPDVPLWAALLIVLVAYQIVVAPFRLAGQWGSSPAPGVPAWFAFWQAVAWLIGLAFVVWIASNHLPEIREFLQRVPEVFREFVQAMRRLLAR